MTRPMALQVYVLFASVLALARPVWSQNVGIGQPLPQEKLHVNGNLRLDGDTLMGNQSSPATVLHLLSNGGISLKLDANDDGSERFSVKKSGPDLGSVVFEVTEAGNTTADGFGDFNGYGRFNGNFTLAGDSRKFYTGENFDLVANGSVEIYLDANADNASSDFGILNDTGDFLFLLEEDKSPTVYPFGTLSGQSGGIRFRELAAGGSSSIGLRAPDGLSANIWLTLPTTDGLPGQVLQTDGSGVLSWVNPAFLRSGEDGREGAALWSMRELSLNAGDSTGVALSAEGPCWLAAQHVESGGVGGINTSCAVLPAEPVGVREASAGGAIPDVSLRAWGAGETDFPTAIRSLDMDETRAIPVIRRPPGWSLSGTCLGACTRLVCRAVCAP